MSSKVEFMEYAKKRLKEKEYKKRKLIEDISSVQVDGIRRCSGGKWKPKQRTRW